MTESPEEMLRNLRTALAAYEGEHDSSPDFSHKLQLVEEFLDKPDEELGRFSEGQKSVFRFRIRIQGSSGSESGSRVLLKGLIC